MNKTRGYLEIIVGVLMIVVLIKMFVVTKRVTEVICQPVNQGDLTILKCQYN